MQHLRTFCVTVFYTMSVKHSETQKKMETIICFEMVWYGFFRRNEKGRIARENNYIFLTPCLQKVALQTASLILRPADGYVATK
mmetsp:Transcript_16279/g.23873  ORF Transcript_16279/g.23873 Transcript_16279/m.23873 type:complete len:84 (-) Transcript_16279:122-373(-)